MTVTRILAALALVAPLGSAIQAQEGSSPAAGLRLEISSAGTAFDPSDLIIVKVQFVNSSDKPIDLLLSPDLPGCVSLYYQGPAIRRTLRKQFGPLTTSEAYRVKLNTGERCQTYPMVSVGFYDQRDSATGEVRTLFKTPDLGEWQVWAELGTVKSNVLKFTCEEQRIDAEVRSLFGSETWHRMAMGEKLDKESFDRFRDFVFSGRPAGQKDVMGHLVGISCANDSDNELAARAFDAALQSGGSNWPKSSHRFMLARVRAHLKQFDEAVRQLDQIDASELPLGFARRFQKTREEITQARDKAMGGGR